MAIYIYVCMYDTLPQTQDYVYKLTQMFGSGVGNIRSYINACISENYIWQVNLLFCLYIF